MNVLQWKDKNKLRFCLFLYMIFITCTPEIYSLYSLFVDGISTVVAILSILQFINFLKSRKPSEKNILSRQMLLNFYLKLVYYPLYYMMVYVGFTYDAKSMSHGVTGLLVSTILSYTTTRIWIILTFTMYMLISISRALLIISPSTFLGLNVNFSQTVSILVLLLVFAVEVTLSLLVYAKCDVNEKGHKLHTLMDLNNFYKNSVCGSLSASNESTSFPDTCQQQGSNESLELMDRTQQEKVCHLFPSFRIICTIIIILEVLRFIVAMIRFKKMLELKKVGPRLEAKACSVDPCSDRSIKGLTAADMTTAQQAETIQLQQTRTDTLKESSSEPPINILHVAPINQSDGTIDQAEITDQTPEQPLQLERCLTIVAVNAETQARKPEKSLAFSTNVFRNGKQNFQDQDLQAHKESSVEEENQFGLNIPEIQRKRNLAEFKSYITLLMWRTYSLLLFIIVLHFFIFLLPDGIFQFLEQLRLQTIVVKLDLYFVPAFWIMVDKGVWRFTKKSLKKWFISLRVQFVHGDS